MLRKNVEVVRQPLTVTATSGRSLEAELLVRFSRLVGLLAKGVWWLYVLLPPRSRLRQAIPRHYVRLCFEALNRKDLEVAFALFHPDVESSVDQRMVSLGIEPVYRGLPRRIDMQRRWNAEWGDWQYEPNELIDLGKSRMLITGHLRGRGLSSGISVGQEAQFLLTISGGRVIREEVRLDLDETFEAAGLSD